MKARNRTIGPEHLLDEAIYVLERQSGLPIRWALSGLKCIADREGRFPWLPNQIKRVVLPYDAVNMAEVLETLERGGVIVQYVFAGKVYGFIPAFQDDQAVNPRETASILPPPSAVDIERWRTRALGLFETNVPDASVTRAGDEQAGDSTRSGTGERRVRDSASPEHDSISGPAPPGESSEKGNGASGHNPNNLRDLKSAADASMTLGGSVEAVRNASRARAGFVGSVALDLSSTEGEKATPESLLTSFVNSDSPEQSSGISVVLAHRMALTTIDASGSQQALPAIRGKRTLEAMRERMTQVATEIATGVRRRLYKDQRRKLGAEIVFGYWIELFSHPRAWLDDKREGTIVRRLQENSDDVGELLYALDGARKDTPRNKDTGEVYDGIPTLFRDRAQVERFAERMPAYRKGEPHPVMAQYADMFRELSDAQIQENAGQQTLLPSGDT